MMRRVANRVEVAFIAWVAVLGVDGERLMSDLCFFVFRSTLRADEYLLACACGFT